MSAGFTQTLKEYYNIFFTVIFRFIAFVYRRVHGLPEDMVFIGFSSAWYGGNVKGLLDACLREKNLVENKQVRMYFTSPNKNQVEYARNMGVESYWWHDLGAIPVFARTCLFICSHGESSLPVTRRKFFYDFKKDVLGEFGQKLDFRRSDYHGKGFAVKRLELWHGIPFKDVYIDKIPIPPDVFCVTSDFMKKCYTGKGYNPNVFRVTGYPRNDILFAKVDKKEVFSSLNIPAGKKIVLYAPTWGHYTGKGLFPWNNWAETFAQLDKFAEKQRDVFFVIRTHKYWEGEQDDDVEKTLDGCSNVAWVSMDDYPDTYRLLAVTDVLITDWSSIAFDFMLVRKPIVFVACPNPYKKFCFTAEERAGAIVKNQEELLNVLSDSLGDPKVFIKKYSSNFDKILNKAFLYKDGKTSERCIKEIRNLLKN